MCKNGKSQRIVRPDLQLITVRLVLENESAFLHVRHGGFEIHKGRLFKSEERGLCSFATSSVKLELEGGISFDLSFHSFAEADIFYFAHERFRWWMVMRNSNGHDSDGDDDDGNGGGPTRVKRSKD